MILRFGLSLFLASSLFAQVVDDVTQHKVRSEILGEERTIIVRTPASYARGATKYPVLYLTDAESQFVHTAATADFLARHGRMPEVVLVAIANTQRTRDLTPTVGGFVQAGKKTEIPGSGGGDRFLDFIEKELIPFVDRTYRTAPFRIHAGHSFGGLLAMHAFITRPALFQATLAVSPSLGWDGDLIEKSLSKAKRSDRPRFLFFTIGNEGEALRVAYERVRSEIGRNFRKELSWSSKIYPDDDHGSVVLPSHYDGFRAIFNGWQIDPRGNLTLEGADSHYDKLSERYGFAVATPESLINRIGYGLMTKNKMEEATRVFWVNAKRFPESPNVYDSLGEALERSGKLKEAGESYARAVTLGRKYKDPQLAAYETNLARVPQK